MKRFIYLTLCILTCAFLLTACGKDTDHDSSDTITGTSSLIADEYDDENIDVSSKEETSGEDDLQEVPVNDVSSEEAEDQTGDSSLTDAQENVSENPEAEFHGSGTFNGFVDSSSVEITMADGTYQTFFVYEETVYNQLTALSEKEGEVTIQFTYKAIEGQINPEIIAVN